MTEIKVIREDEKATAILKAIQQIDDGAELEPVVRCKGCKWYNGHHYCTYFADTVLDNDFCSYGKRKEITDGKP